MKTTEDIGTTIIQTESRVLGKKSEIAKKLFILYGIQLNHILFTIELVERIQHPYLYTCFLPLPYI